MKRSDLILLAAALLCGAGFLASLDRLWPVVELPLDLRPRELERLSLEAGPAVGRDLTGWSRAHQVVLDEPALSWLERGRPRGELHALVADLPVYLHEIRFKKRGEPGEVVLWVHPKQGLVGWRRVVEDDAPGRRLDSAAGYALALGEARAHLGVDFSGWFLERRSLEHMDSRDDQVFVFRREAWPGSGVWIRTNVALAGDLVREVRPSVVVPSSWIRRSRERQAREQFLQTAAFTVFASMGVAAFLYKLSGLRRRIVGLRTPAIGASVVVVCLGAARLLRDARLFELWDPLGPRWMSILRVLLQGAVNDMLPALMVFSFLAASDALDREAPRHRGIALRNFLRLRWSHVDVGHASLRGFLLGWVAGGLLALSTWALSFLPGAQVELQPRGFFFFGTNSLSPTLLLGLFFLQIALVEELGYRHFAGNALLRLGFGRWSAAALPALVYGMVHSGLSFLPPADPWWARTIPIGLVGVLWGLAFVRWDALTVVLSHWACDLFLFNRARLVSDDPWTRLSAVACISLPLLPAAVDVGWRLWERWRGARDPEEWSDDSDFSGFDPGTEPELPVVDPGKPDSVADGGEGRR